MYLQLRPAARIMRLTQKMRQSLPLAILTCVPGWSIPIQPTVADLCERIWPPGPVYMQIGQSCIGYALAAWLDATPHCVADHPSGWQIYQAALAQDGIAGPHEDITVEAGLAVLARLRYAHDWQATTDPARALAFLRADGSIVILSAFPDGMAVLDGGGKFVWAPAQTRHAWLCYGVDAND